MSSYKLLPIRVSWRYRFWWLLLHHIAKSKQALVSVFILTRTYRFGMSWTMQSMLCFSLEVDLAIKVFKHYRLLKIVIDPVRMD